MCLGDQRGHNVGFTMLDPLRTVCANTKVWEYTRSSMISSAAVGSTSTSTLPNWLCLALLEVWMNLSRWTLRSILMSYLRQPREPY